MTESIRSPAPAVSGPPPPALSRRGTMLAAVVLAGFVAFYGWLHLTSDRLDRVDEPDRALLLVVGRTLDAEAALERAPAWERRLHRAAGLESGRELDEAIRWFDELAGASLDPRVDVALVVLAGEAGHLGQVRRTAAEWASRDEPLPSLADIVTAAYLTPPRDSGEILARWAQIAPDVPAGWFRDRLALRLAEAVGDPTLAREARASLGTRLAPLLGRIRAINVGLLVVLAGGAVAAILAVRRRRAGERALRVAWAPLPPPWSGQTGLAVVVRAAAIAAVLSVGASVFLTYAVHLDEAVSEAALSAVMIVPFMVLVPRWLLAPVGLDLRRAFGLSLAPGGSVALALSVTMLIAAGLVVDLGATLAGEWRGWSAHWTEWFDATLAWGRPLEVMATLLGLVVVAPVLEEIVFRGLVFATLRRRFSTIAAAALSAAVFAIAHGYGAVGSISVFVSGFLWAIAYERTGSLLPVMLAHAASNLITALVLMTLLR